MLKLYIRGALENVMPVSVHRVDAAGRLKICSCMYGNQAFEFGECVFERRFLQMGRLSEQF